MHDYEKPKWNNEKMGWSGINKHQLKERRNGHCRPSFTAEREFELGIRALDFKMEKEHGIAYLDKINKVSIITLAVDLLFSPHTAKDREPVDEGQGKKTYSPSY